MNLQKLICILACLVCFHLTGCSKQTTDTRASVSPTASVSATPAPAKESGEMKFNLPDEEEEGVAVSRETMTRTSKSFEIDSIEVTEKDGQLVFVLKGPELTLSGDLPEGFQGDWTTLEGQRLQLNDAIESRIVLTNPAAVPGEAPDGVLTVQKASKLEDGSVRIEGHGELVLYTDTHYGVSTSGPFHLIKPH